MKRILKISLIVMGCIGILFSYIIFFTGTLVYTEEIEIDAPIETVIALFNNPYNMVEYMDDIESYKVLSGSAGEIGAKAEIIAVHIEEDIVKRRIVMIEEIVTNNLPEEKKITYTSDFIYNVVVNRIKSSSKDKSIFINEQEFQFKGTMKVIAFFMPKSSFKKQSRIYLNSFKEFVENQ